MRTQTELDNGADLQRKNNLARQLEHNDIIIGFSNAQVKLLVDYASYIMHSISTPMPDWRANTDLSPAYGLCFIALP